MRIIAKVFLFIGLLFWATFLFVDLSNFLAMNGSGNLFPIDTPEVILINVEKDSTHVNIAYSYKVDEIEYQDTYRMVKGYYEKCNVDTLVIKQNRIFPSISYIENIPLKLRQAKMGIYISLFFLLFLIMLWKLSNRSKVIKTYEEIGNRPWLYPDDNTIKNPWKRLKNRLFQK